MAQQAHESQVMTTEELVNFASYQNDGSYVFDFSRIPNENGDQILATLVQMAKKDLKSLTLCLDFYYQIYEMNSSFKSVIIPGQTFANEPEMLANSVYRKDKSALQAIIIALKYILSRSKNLEVLKLRNIPFSSNQILQISKTFEKCTSLRSLTFDNIPLFDDGFALISRAIRKVKLTQFKCQKCSLTDSSTSSIKMLLNCYSTGNRKVKAKGLSNQSLQVLDLQYNSFSYRLLLDIGDVLSIIPLKILDIRFNQMIDPKIAKNMKTTIHGLDIRINSQIVKSKNKYDF